MCSVSGNILFLWTYSLVVPQSYVFEQVVLAYGAESDRSLGIPGEVCFIFIFVFSRIEMLCLNPDRF